MNEELIRNGADHWGFHQQIGLLAAIGLMTIPWSAKALDIDLIFIEVDAEHFADVLVTPLPFELEVDVCGSNLSSGTVTTPTGSMHPLEIDDGCLTLFTLPRFAVAPSGIYTLSVSGTDPGTGLPVSDSVSLSFEVSQPLEFASITCPSPNGVGGVSRDPVLEWSSVSGSGDAIALLLGDVSFEDEIWDEDPVPIDATFWVNSIRLEPNQQHEFAISAYNRIGRSESTVGGDFFTYLQQFDQGNGVVFSTGSGICGDGTTDGCEECDDGNDVSLDGCEPDCTATVADTDDDGVVDRDDNCPFVPNPSQTNTCPPPPEGICHPAGDACQCGDVDVDGDVDDVDGFFVRSYLADSEQPGFDLTRCSVSGDAETCDILDAVIIERFAAGVLSTFENNCAAAGG